MQSSPKHTYIHIQICSGITSGRVLNGELYAQILWTLIYLHTTFTISKVVL